MSTLFVGEGNIGSVPEYQEFNTNPDEPRRLLRLNVYFDNPVPREGGYEDRGGYWAPVELWNRDAEHWATLFQKGMRVLVEGRTVKEEWEDSEDNARVTFKVEARRIGILPHRLASVTMREKASDNASTSRKGGGQETATQVRVSAWYSVESPPAARNHWSRTFSSAGNTGCCRCFILGGHSYVAHVPVFASLPPSTGPGQGMPASAADFPGPRQSTGHVPLPCPVPDGWP